MKVLIVSDTHSRHENLAEAIKREGRIDLMVHLGDAEGCESQIQKLVGCPLEIVSGNCDFFSSLSQEKEIEIGDSMAFLTHGHYYNVNAGIEDIQKEARGRGCGLVMFGHTHRPIIHRGKDIIALNPGSLSYPRQEGRRPSYIVMQIGDDGAEKFEIRYL